MDKGTGPVRLKFGARSSAVAIPTEGVVASAGGLLARRRGGASPVLRNPNPTAPPTALRGAVYGVVNVGISIPPRGVFPPTMIRIWVGVTRPLGELGKMGGFGGQETGGRG